MTVADARARWLLLIHQIPPKPAYLRAKILRRLQRLGAVAIKNSVYVLPANEDTQEDFAWVLAEIRQRGGDALVCEARMIDGLSDGEVEERFNSARHGDYTELVEEVRHIVEEPGAAVSAEAGEPYPPPGTVDRLKRRLEEIVAIDFFNTPSRGPAEQAIARLDRQRCRSMEAATVPNKDEYRGRTWVTRKSIHIDRIASSWLIRRFIDADARFKFVPGKSYGPEGGEVRFDMFEGEFTHEGDLCTFEVLVDRFALHESALDAIAEIVHDIDLKESKSNRPETPGIAQLVGGIAVAHAEDEARMARGAAVFDDLYEMFRRSAR